MKNHKTADLLSLHVGAGIFVAEKKGSWIRKNAKNAINSMTSLKKEKKNAKQKNHRHISKRIP